MTQKEINVAIYNALLSHCRRVFAFVACKPGQYTLKDLQHLNDKDAYKFGICGFYKHFEDYEITITVDSFSCTLPAYHVFKLAAKFAVLAGQGGKKAAIFERTEDEKIQLIDEAEAVAPAVEDVEDVAPAVMIEDIDNPVLVEIPAPAVEDVEAVAPIVEDADPLPSVVVLKASELKTRATAPSLEAFTENIKKHLYWDACEIRPAVIYTFKGQKLCYEVFNNNGFVSYFVVTVERGRYRLAIVPTECRELADRVHAAKNAEDVAPAVEDVEDVAPAVEDFEAVAPAVEDVEPVAPAVEDVEAVAPAVDDFEPVAPVWINKARYIKTIISAAAVVLLCALFKLSTINNTTAAPVLTADTLATLAAPVLTADTLATLSPIVEQADTLATLAPIVETADTLPTLAPIVETADTLAHIVEQADTLAPIVEQADTLAHIVEQADTLAHIVEQADTLAPIVEQADTLPTVAPADDVDTLTDPQESTPEAAALPLLLPFLIIGRAKNGGNKAQLQTITADQIARALLTLCALVMAYIIQHTGHALTMGTRSAIKFYNLTTGHAVKLWARYRASLATAALFAVLAFLLYVSAVFQAARM